MFQSGSVDWTQDSTILLNICLMIHHNLTISCQTMRYKLVTVFFFFHKNAFAFFYENTLISRLKFEEVFFIIF